MSSVRIYLIDDHHLVRAGLQALLQEVEGFEVVGAAADAETGLQAVERLRPDVVLLDVAMPGVNGFEALRRLRQSHPALPVVMLSMYGSEEHLLKSMRERAMGYVLKSAAPEVLEAAIRSAVEGVVFSAPGAGSAELAGYLERVQTRAVSEPLTPRQQEVLGLLAQGVQTKEIAYRLNLSPKTVDTFRAQIMARLQIRDVAGLVRYAISHGLVQP
jgi:DNA-binding NarL/FixJ family response regulator